MDKETLLKMLAENLSVEVSTDSSQEGDRSYVSVTVRVLFDDICIAEDSSSVNV